MDHSICSLLDLVVEKYQEELALRTGVGINLLSPAWRNSAWHKLININISYNPFCIWIPGIGAIWATVISRSVPAVWTWWEQMCKMWFYNVVCRGQSNTAECCSPDFCLTVQPQTFFLESWRFTFTRPILVFVSYLCNYKWGSQICGNSICFLHDFIQTTQVVLELYWSQLSFSPQLKNHTKNVCEYT